jgi:hypothetical protein
VNTPFAEVKPTDGIRIWQSVYLYNTLCLLKYLNTFFINSRGLVWYCKTCLKWSLLCWNIRIIIWWFHVMLRYCNFCICRSVMNTCLCHFFSLQKFNEFLISFFFLHHMCIMFNVIFHDLLYLRCRYYSSDNRMADKIPTTTEQTGQPAQSNCRGLAAQFWNGIWKIISEFVICQIMGECIAHLLSMISCSSGEENLHSWRFSFCLKKKAFM